MEEKLKISSKEHGLGDTIILTALSKYLTNKIVIQLPKKNERFKVFFENLSEVEITDELKTPIEDIGDGHYATRKLRNFFGKDADALDNRPLVIYSDIESERWVTNYLKSIKKPVIFVPNCSLRHAQERNMPKNRAERALTELRRQECTPIFCLSSKNLYKTDCENQLIDLDIKKYICLLRRVAVYFGCNTGDMHLAVAVGAMVNTFQPNVRGVTFNRVEWDYRHPSVKYFLW